jgi:IS605 OrfB family transposase
MKQCRTIKLKLNTNPNEWYDTFDAYTKAYNYICSIGWNDKDINAVSLHHKTYDTVRTFLPSQLACSARAKAAESLKSVKVIASKGKNVSCPNSSRTSIRLDKNSYTIWFNRCETSILTINGRKKVSFSIPEYFNQYLSWKQMSAELIIIQNYVFLHITFEKDYEDISDTNDIVLGIDRGINHLAVSSDNKFYSGKEIKRISERYERKRSKLQASKNRSSKRHFSKINRKEQRFRKNTNHVITKRIVNTLPQFSTIVLENLTNIRESSKKFRKDTKRQINKWNFYQFEQFLKYKSEQKYIQIKYVDARYTSQKCSNCGCIIKSNRKSQAYYHCSECNFKLNADLNASRNIKNNYLQSIGYADRAVVNQPIALSA